MMEEKGLIHIYTGDGKGKTTAAVGLAVRAIGDGMRVLFVQFLKGRATGELKPLEQIGVHVVRAQKITKFIPRMTEQELKECRHAHQECLCAAKEGMEDYDLIILDEVIGATKTGMIDIDELIAIVKGKRNAVEFVLTGRDAPIELIELADYVSEIKAIRHPYNKGIGARKGIEY